MDTLAAVPLTLLGPVAGISALTSSCEGEECFGAAIVGLYAIPITLIDIIYVASAVHGFRTANKCVEAHEAHQRALRSPTPTSTSNRNASIVR